MIKKGMLKKISCITLAGLIALSGHSMAETNRAEAISKIHESDVGTIMVDKVLGYGSNYDLRLYKYFNLSELGTTNAAWALNAVELLELEADIQYSAKHIDYTTASNSTNEGTPNSHNRNLGQGGNMAVALGYLTSGRGPVLENDLKWDGNTNKVALSTLQGKETRGRLESYKVFPNIYKVTYDMMDNKTLTYGFNSPSIYEKAKDEIQDFDAYGGFKMYDGGDIEQNRQEIKEHIIKHGAVSANIYRDNQYLNAVEQNDEYYEVEYGEGYRDYYQYISNKIYNPASYYCNKGNQTPNNNVLIIGWDDEFQVPGAPGRGAYIVLDPNTIDITYYDKCYDKSGWYSWKHSYNKKYGNAVEQWINGKKYYCWDKQNYKTNFYYVSYYDYYIESEVYGIKDFEKISTDTKTPYQWDTLGMSAVIETDTSMEYAYGANVFARNTENAESLDSVSIATMANMKYEIYVNPKSGELKSEKLIKVAETDMLDSGYNTIYFDEPIMLTGKKFAVAVKYIPEDGYENTAQIGVQSPKKIVYRTEGENTTKTQENIKYWETATSAQGRSFIGTSLDSWTDLYNNAETKNMSICIKAFTTEMPGYEIPAESIKLQQMETDTIATDITGDIQAIKGDAVQLYAEVLPEDAKNKKVSWTSSNKTVATVDANGLVTTHSAGKVTITAKMKNALGIQASCTIDVRVPIESFVLNKNNVTILAGETNILAGIIGPEDATTTKIEWTSSNKEVVKVTEDGLLIGLKKGSAIVTASIKDESGIHTATCKVTVPETLIVDVLGVSLNKTTLTLQKGTRETLQATVTPADATNTAVVWTSSNKNVAIVNANGRITGLTPGTTTITVTTVSGGETATCTVTVTDVETVSPTGISLNQSSLTLEKDGTSQLTATITPSNSNDNTVIWDSTNLNVAEVNSSGKVTAIDTGTATITATTFDGKFTAKCEVTVTKPTVRVTGITINKTAATIEKGEILQLIAGTEPTNADNKEITYKSSNTSIAKVDANGKITAVGYGTATITATTSDGGYSKTCIIDVPEKISVTGIQISKEEITVQKGRTADLTVAVLPANATNTNINAEISEENIVRITENGVTGLSEGTTTITFKTDDGEYTKTCTITVEAVPEDKITISSSQYEIAADDVIENISANTTVKDFKENIESDGTTIIIKDKNGNELSDTDIIGTGTTIEISKEIEQTPEGESEPEKVQVSETFTAKIDGDIDGDGKISTTDLSLIVEVVMSKKTLEGIYSEAGDLNGDGKISITDLAIIKDLLISDNNQGEGK